MNKFGKVFLASLLAFIVGTFVVFAFFFMIFAGFAASFSTKPIAVAERSVLKIDLGDSIVDSPENKVNTLDLSSYKISGSNTILEVLRAVEYAAEDPYIKGIYINFTGSGGMTSANVEELRSALLKFRESGKFVVSYNETYSTLGYYLCSVSDKVFVNPEGAFDWRGLTTGVMFYKGLLDKLDAEVEVFRHGSFKAGVEPFITDRMSPENRLQTSIMVNSYWNVMLQDIQASRSITAAELNNFAENLTIKDVETAQRMGLVDGLLYQDQVNGYLYALCHDEDPAGRMDDRKSPKVNSVSLSDYIAANTMSYNRSSRNRIALIYADGDIIDGESVRGSIGSITMSEKISNARKDDAIKAVVLRINSPGGSALASEIMWRELKMLQEEKPLIVSMGGYAASGGYYIASPADVILADRSTITGSIGVYGLKLNIDRTLRNKLGITMDFVKTNPSADMMMPFRSLNRSERDFVQYQIEDTYATFVNHVAEGRNMTFDEVDAIAQGRVWLGADANNNGLVDGFGGLDDAIRLAADRASITSDYRVVEITDAPDSFAAIMQMVTGVRAKSRLESELGEAFRDYNMLMNTLSEEGIQARLPYFVDFQ